MGKSRRESPVFARHAPLATSSFMLSYIALTPGVLAFWMANNRSPQEAFLKVYLPNLLFLPDYVRAITPGLPPPRPSARAPRWACSSRP
jgi:hypothetical protein